MKKILNIFLLSTSLNANVMENVLMHTERIKEHRLLGNGFDFFSDDVDKVYKVLDGTQSRIAANRYASDQDRVNMLTTLVQNRLYVDEKALPMRDYIPHVTTDHTDYEKCHLAALRLMLIGVDALVHAPSLGAKRKNFLSYIKNQKDIFDQEHGYQAKKEILSFLSDSYLKNLFPKGFFKAISQYLFNFKDFQKQDELVFGLGIKNIPLSKENGFNITEGYNIHFIKSDHKNIEGVVSSFDEINIFNFQYEEIEFQLDPYKNAKPVYGGHFLIDTFKDINFIYQVPNQNFNLVFNQNQEYTLSQKGVWPAIIPFDAKKYPKIFEKAKNPVKPYDLPKPFLNQENKVQSNDSVNSNAPVVDPREDKKPAKIDVDYANGMVFDLDNFMAAKQSIIDQASCLKVHECFKLEIPKTLNAVEFYIQLTPQFIKEQYEVFQRKELNRNNLYIILEVPRNDYDDIMFIEGEDASAIMKQVLTQYNIKFKIDNSWTKIQILENHGFAKQKEQDIINSYHEALYAYFVLGFSEKVCRMHQKILKATPETITIVLNSCFLTAGCFSARMTKFEEGLKAFDAPPIDFEKIKTMKDFTTIGFYLSEIAFKSGYQKIEDIKHFIITAARENFLMPKGEIRRIKFDEAYEFYKGNFNEFFKELDVI